MQKWTFFGLLWCISQLLCVRLSRGQEGEGEQPPHHPGNKGSCHSARFLYRFIECVRYPTVSSLLVKMARQSSSPWEYVEYGNGDMVPGSGTVFQARCKSTHCGQSYNSIPINYTIPFVFRRPQNNRLELEMISLSVGCTCVNRSNI